MSDVQTPSPADSGVVIVTGASRGIGKAVAQRLTAAGYPLALVARSADTLSGLAEDLGGNVKAYPADISDWDAVQQVVASVQEDFGAIYGLVNNAGMTRDGLFVRMTPEQWQAPLDVNLNGTFFFMRAVASLMMRARQGRIVNISSVIGLTGNSGQANYAASKAGIIALTKSVAKELGGRNVNCNAVAPGFINTEMTADLPANIRDAMLAQIPLKRLGEGNDVAGVVEFLLSPAAAYITGQTLVVDGGMIL
ncbi:3-oxoacyl-[acyl-carrier-protein] reductase [bacterium]|nr:3-oxoacyl-[acyl-carrier-protein] reductase [bacterium]PJA75611.1 MAG: 3-oxoacyl-[acyl-carrier-protein] reductase [bacterium CG_4_9_14_3_um_filter_65_15]